uniref:Ubiquitin thioesterase OTU n=1 Tax=Anthurium amnicola TaxID=1678845 RepID=A0A1D1Z2F4_9ARAE
MMICLSCLTSLRHLICAAGNVGSQIFSQMSAVPGSRLKCTCYIESSQFARQYTALTLSKSLSFSPFGFQARNGRSLSSSLSKRKGDLYSSALSSLISSTGHQPTHLGLSSQLRNMSLKLFVQKERVSRIRWNVRPLAWILRGTAAGVCISFAGSASVSAEADMKGNDEDDGSVICSSHGKKVYTDYSITGIPGDGRCLFRSVAHGACLRISQPLPNENLQRELADELRARVADEFVKRRAETEWFVEGDFDTYVSQMRKPHVWGGEPELLMATHVLQMPITVYMHDEDSGGLITIAEYGQEYGKENPIRVLYHGFGHYDSLEIPGKRGVKSRL